MQLKTNYSIYDNVGLRIDGNYTADNSPCISLIDLTEGNAIFRLTVCLADNNLKEDEAYIDVCDKGQWLEDFIMEYKLGEPTGEIQSSGYCNYPKYRLNLKEIKQYLI